MLRTSFTLSLLALLFIPLVLGMFGVSVAQVMQSTNYQIDSDSVNVTGGFSESTSYQMESTVGEVATGDSDSSNFSVRAGFQQMQAVQISLSPISSVVLSPTIPGVTGGTANGSTTFTVITDNPAGYEVTIQAEGEPAMQEVQSANTIADYAPTTTADYDFRLNSSDAHLGYSIESPAAASRFTTIANSCDPTIPGSNEALQCWDGLSTTTAVIAREATANQPAGTDTTIHFRVGIGGAVNQAPGTYVATTTVTALPL